MRVCILSGVRKLGSIGHSAKQSVEAFVEAVAEKDALQELQVHLVPSCSCGMCQQESPPHFEAASPRLGMAGEQPFRKWVKML